jgi:hypothetical protein
MNRTSGELLEFSDNLEIFLIYLTVDETMLIFQSHRQVVNVGHGDDDIKSCKFQYHSGAF